jgi:hypothetical protein
LRLPLGPAFYAGPMAVDAGGAALLVGDRGSSLFFRRVSKGRVTASVDVEQLVAGNRKLAGAVGYDVLLVCMER